jgi:hypothetical protein
MGRARTPMKCRHPPMLRLCVCLLLFTAGAWGDSLERGVHGYGLTVMEGTRIDTFGVEILGWERNGALPGRDQILVRLAGLGLEETGVPGGMSGSPVYVEDRLVGAVAWGWSFANEPICLVTPIDQMLELWQRDLSGTPPQETTPPPASGPGWRRLRSPLWVSGAGPVTLSLLTELLAPLGFEPLSGTVGDSGGDMTPVPVQPGSAIGVRLIGGDLNIASIGTVTHVEGDRVLAFGHNMVGNGAIDVPFTAARIYGIMASEYVSFKLGSTMAVVGAARQDRFAGVAGLTSDRARTLPMVVEVQTATGIHHFDFELARHRFYTTRLAQVSLMGSLESVAKARGDASVTLTLDVKLEDGRTLSWQRLYSGLNAPLSVARDIGLPLQSLDQSAFEDVQLASIHAQLEVAEEIHAARVENVRLDPSPIVAGSVAQLTVHLVPFQAAPHDIAIDVPIPGDTAGEMLLRIGSGSAAASWEQTRWPQGPAATSDELLRRLQQPLRDDELIIELVSTTPGLAIGGRELPAPPPSVQQLLTAAQTAGHVQPLSTRVLLRRRIVTEYILRGEHSLRVNIESKGTR